MRILVVDDEKDIRPLFEQRFRREIRNGELHFIFAYSGEEALIYLENYKSEAVLILSDINMPGMNGIEVLRIMKEVNADLPVILSSAYQEYKQDFGTWASEEYIVKSANLDELKKAVKKYLD